MFDYKFIYLESERQCSRTLRENGDVNDVESKIMRQCQIRKSASVDRHRANASTSTPTTIIKTKQTTTLNIITNDVSTNDIEETRRARQPIQTTHPRRATKVNRPNNIYQ